jgi:hypothetical protein
LHVEAREANIAELAIGHCVKRLQRGSRRAPSFEPCIQASRHGADTTGSHVQYRSELEQ